MKFEDLIVGMRVRDHIGNTYEVVALAADDSYGYGIKLCCELWLNLYKQAMLQPLTT